MPAPDAGYASAIAVQPDGKILLAGVMHGVAAVVRLTPTGALDTSFSGDGFATFPQFHAATGVGVGPGGKIVVGGYNLSPAATRPADRQRFAAARLNPDGTPDNTFAGDGVTVLSAADAGYASAVAIQPDGKVVLVGTYYRRGADGGVDSNVGVARLTAGGGYDNSFSGDGRLAFHRGDDDAGQSVDLTPSGQILVGSVLDHGVGGALRLTTGGAVDLVVDLPHAVQTQSIALLRDIRTSFDGNHFYLFVEHAVTTGTAPLTTVARYDSDGTRDLTFGPPGAGAFAGAGESVGDLTADGKLVTAGNPSFPPDQEPEFDNTKVQARRRITAIDPNDRIRLAENIVIEGTPGNDVIRATYDPNAGEFVFRLNSQTFRIGTAAIFHVRIDGGLGDDDIVTADARIMSWVNGGYGNDAIVTGLRDDLVFGGGGNDSINTGDGVDTIDAGDGDDRVIAGGGNDAVVGGRGRDQLYGQGGDDTVAGAYAGAFDNVPDYLDGGAGFDTSRSKEPGDATFSIERLL